MHTGDILTDPKHNESWTPVISTTQYPVLITAGNHDVGNWSMNSGQYRFDSDFYNMFIAPSISSWNLKTDGGGTPNIAGKNYYFKDFTEEKIRFIVNYEYEIPSTGGTLTAGRGARWISQEQMNWFIDALKTTPVGYGIVLAHHASEGLKGNDDNPFNSLYKQGTNTQQTYQYKSGTVYVSLYADIIQAFIERKTINYTIEQNAGGTEYNNTLIVTANFTTVDNSIEFICHCSGHIHADGISRIATHPKQLELSIHSDSLTTNPRGDLKLIEGSPFQDVINVYNIDRNQGIISVLRIGANYSADGDRRDMLKIKYRD